MRGSRLESGIETERGFFSVWRLFKQLRQPGDKECILFKNTVANTV